MSGDAGRRARWPWVLLIVAGILAVLVVAAEFVARSVLPGVVRAIVIEQLELPDHQQLDVEATGILLTQLIGGRLDELHLQTDSVTIGGITGSAAVTAVGVPLRGGNLDGADGTVRIDQDQFTALVAASDLPIQEIAFAAPDVTASGSFAVFGVTVPVALTVEPAVDAGDLLLAPVELRVAGVTVNAAEIVERFGAAAAELTEPHRVCIADQLPAGITVTDLTIEDSAAVIDIDVAGSIVSDEALQRRGVCD